MSEVNLDKTDTHMRECMYKKLHTRSEAPLSIHRIHGWSEIFHTSSKFFSLPLPPSTCQYPYPAWLSKIAGISTHRLWLIARVSSSSACVYVCLHVRASKQARLMLGWSVCGKRRMIRPIWFVLQSQIKQEWWGIDSGGLWRHDTAVATHIYTTTVPSVSEKTSKKAFWRIPS